MINQAREVNPRIAVVIMSGHANLEDARRAIRVGALDLFTKSWQPEDVDRFFSAIDRAVESSEARRRADATRASYARGLDDDLVGQSLIVNSLRENIRRLAGADSTVLIEGPTGAGKDLVARKLHLASRFSHGPFVPVDLPSLQPELIASELFGTTRGAFTGAEDKAGAFEVADGGTLFLDEIGELRLDLQAKLLRAIETKCITRVGGHREIQLDVRVLAATNRSLRTMVDDEMFRRDLYFRLSSLHIQVAPLSERREDIPLLAEHFLRRQTRRLGRVRPAGFEPSALEMLMAHDWPGNVRELASIVERVVLSAQSHRVTQNTVAEVLGVRGSGQYADTNGTSLKHRLEALEREWLEDYLRQTKGSIRQAAALAGESYSTFYNRIRRRNVDTKSAKRRRVLVVDDHELVRKSLAVSLQRRDFDVELRCDGTEAVDLLARDRTFDAILCDIGMPAMDGIEVFRYLQAELPQLVRRFVFVTGLTEGDELYKRALQTGAPVVDKTAREVLVAVDNLDIPD